MNIDRSRLPQVALVDTNVFLRFLREKIDANTDACVSFCEAMIAVRYTILIAAPSLAEVVRFRGARPPRVAGIEVVPFDARAAERLGAKLQHANLVELREETGIPLHYWKYDSLILACAMRWKAHCIVTTDGPLKKLAVRSKFSAYHPGEFELVPKQVPLPKQLTLPAAPVSGSSGAAGSEAPSPATEAGASDASPPVAAAASASSGSTVPSVDATSPVPDQAPAEPPAAAPRPSEAPPALPDHTTEAAATNAPAPAATEAAEGTESTASTATETPARGSEPAT